MTLIVQELTDDNTFEEIGRVEDGEVSSDELLAIYPEETWQDLSERELAARLNGPYIMAGIVNENKGVRKEWVPYEGPRGGTGWRNTQTDEVVYDDEPPGETAESVTEVDVDNPGFEEMANRGYVSQPEGPDLRVETADRTESLYDDPDAHPGASAQHMDVAYWTDEDGETERKAFVTNYGENLQRDHTGEKPTLGERAIAADALLRNLGMGHVVPKHFYDREEGYLAVEGVDGDDVHHASPAAKNNVDDEEFKAFAAGVILMGNSDMHGQNVLVEDDGTFHAVDLDKSGGDFTEPNRFRRRGVNMILRTAQDLGVDLDREELDETCQELASNVDIDEALTGVQNSQITEKPHHQFRENIRANIEAFQQGSVL